METANIEIKVPAKPEHKVWRYAHVEKPSVLNSKLTDGLFNDRDPFRLKTRELPWERQAQAMATQGCSIKEIATCLGKAEQTVSNALRQPHARERMINEVKQNVQDEMRRFLEAEVMPTLEVLKEIRDNDQAKNSDRLAASEQLLSRFLGKPTQPITSDAKDERKLSDAELAAEVNRLVSGVSAPPEN